MTTERAFIVPGRQNPGRNRVITSRKHEVAKFLARPAGWLHKSLHDAGLGIRPWPEHLASSDAFAFADGFAGSPMRNLFGTNVAKAG